MRRAYDYWQNQPGCCRRSTQAHRPRPACTHARITRAHRSRSMRQYSMEFALHTCTLGSPSSDRNYFRRDATTVTPPARQPADNRANTTQPVPACMPQYPKVSKSQKTKQQHGTITSHVASQSDTNTQTPYRGLLNKEPFLRRALDRAVLYLGWTMHFGNHRLLHIRDASRGFSRKCEQC